MGTAGKIKAAHLGLCIVLTMASAMGQTVAQEILPGARDALPAQVRDSGVLNVATNFNWPPFVYQSKNNEVVGIEVSLLKILAAKLGLEAKFNDLKFPALIPGVSSGRFDVAVNQLGYTKERANVVDFVPDFKTTYGLLVPASADPTNPNDLCGKKLVITTGSSVILFIEQISAECTAVGRTAVQIQYYPTTAETLLALTNGRGDGFIAAKAVAIYISHNNPALKLAEGNVEGYETINGMIVAKGSGQLQTALKLALEDAVADGSYAKVLSEFGVPDGNVTLEQIRAPEAAHIR
jgi:polar amino acid transport system substrate-binding protein